MPIIEYQSATQEVTQAEYDLIWKLYNPGQGNVPKQQVLAIKFLRQQYVLGLYEAKRICDAIGLAPSYINNQEPNTLGQLLRAKLNVVDRKEY